MHRGLQGGHQSETVNFFPRCARKNLNCGDYTNDKHKIPMTFVIQLQHPRKGPDLDSFSDFLKKLETSPWSHLCTIFLPQDIFDVKRPKLSENQKMDQ